MSRIASRRALAALLAAGLALGLAGCAEERFAQDYGTNEQGYVAGDGSWQEFPAEQRGAAVAFAGTSADGEAVDSAAFAGRVAVVNFWYAACPPCRAEAADLEALHQRYQPQDVPFVGVNIYDQAPTAKAFETTYGITYPSILDVETGAAHLAFAETVPPQAIPSTVVLDRQGRVAGVIRGPVDDSILASMIDRALAEAA